MSEPHAPLIDFDLPCNHEGCKSTVSFHSDRSKDWVDFWLDGIIVVFCPLHRARA